MGRTKGSRSATDYFGGSQKAEQAHADQPEQQQQQSGLRRILTLFRGSSQARQPAEGPASSAASSFLVSWRSTRGPADILTVEQAKASVSFAGELAPRWESMATDVVAAASDEGRQQQEDDDEQREYERERPTEEEERRRQQSFKLRELQRQATTMRERPAPRLEYQPSMNARGAAAAAAAAVATARGGELGLGQETEVLRLGLAAGGREGQYGPQALPLTPAAAPAPWRDEDEEPQLRLAAPPQPLPPSEAARRLHTHSSKQMLIPTPPPTQKPAQQLSPSGKQPPPQLPYCRASETLPPPHHYQQHYSHMQPPDRTYLDGSGRDQLRLPAFPQRDGATASPSRLAAAAAAAGGGLRLQACASPRPSLNGASARTAPVEYLGDEVASAAAEEDFDPRVGVHRRYTAAALSGYPSPVAPAGGPTAPASSGPRGPRSLADELRDCGHQPPASPRMTTSMPHPFVMVSAGAPPPLTVPVQMPLAAPSSSSSPPQELMLLSLALAPPALPAMDIFPGAGVPARVAAPGSDPTPCALSPLRSKRALTGTGYYGSGGGAPGGLGPACLTADVALATSPVLGPAPAYRASTPGGGGGGGAGVGGSQAVNDALARRTALLREAFKGTGSMRRTVQSLQGTRMSSNGIAGEDGSISGAVGRMSQSGADRSSLAAAAAAAPLAAAFGDEPPTRLSRSRSQQREESTSSSLVSERPANWESWKQRSRETNWAMWKSHSTLTSRLRHDLESRAAEEAAVQRAGSGANSPGPSSGSTPRWKAMLEATAAALEAPGSGSNAGGADGSPVTDAAAFGGGLAAALAVRDAAASGCGCGGSGEDGGGGSDRSVDGAPLPRTLLRAASTRTSRAATPAAKTGRMLLRAATMTPTLVTLQNGNPAAVDDGRVDDEGTGSADSGPLGGMHGSPTAGPRAGRRAPVPPPALPSRLSIEAGAGTGPPPPPHPPHHQQQLPAAAVPLPAVSSPRIAAVERARERSQAGFAAAAAAAARISTVSPTRQTPFAAHDWAAAVDLRASSGSPPPLPRHSSPNLPMPGSALSPLPRHSNPIEAVSAVLTARVYAGAHSGAGSPVPAGAAALAPSPPVPYRVSLMGVAGVRHTDSGAVESSRRGSLNGAGANPRSRRTLHVSGSVDQAACSGLVPLPPPLPPPAPREWDADAGMPATPLPYAYPTK